MIILDEQENQQRSSGVPTVVKSSNKTDTSSSSSVVNTSTIPPPPPPPPYISPEPSPSSPSYPYFHQTAHHHHHHHPHHSQPTTPTHSPTTVTHPGTTTTTTAVEDHPLVIHYRIQEQELEKRTLKRFFGAFLIALMIVTLSSTFVRIIAEVARSGGRHRIHTIVVEGGGGEVIGISESVVLPSRTLLEEPTPIVKERILSIAYPLR